MMIYDFELLIIGAGPSGLAAAKRAANYGMKVAIVEQKNLGGCCVNRGCVPKKLMVYASDYAATMQDAAEFGWEQGTSSFHWQQFRAKRDQELQRLRQVQMQALQKAKIAVLEGQAQFQDPHTLLVNRNGEEQKYTAEKILVAVGGKPVKPNITGIEHTLTSDDLLNLEQIPQRIAIIGGGYVGVEFASILNNFGSDVTVMNREACILEGFDDDLRSTIREGLVQRGIQSLCSTTTDKITQTAAGLDLHLTGDCPERLTADVILCAVGRAPNLDGLQLEKAGVKFDQKAIAVDQQSRTNLPHIYAVGDCTNRKQLTPVARAEGRAAVDAMLGKSGTALNYTMIPSAVLSRPEAASVGLTEAQAREQYGDAVECHSKTFVPLRYSLLNQKQQAFIKFVINSKTDRLLGVHMVGENAAEIVQSGTIALQKGMTYQELQQTIGIHPSTAEELFSLE